MSFAGGAVREERYDGSVTNLNIFRAESNVNIRNFSTGLCDELEIEAYLAWNSVEFDCTGKANVVDLPGEEICGNKSTQNIFLDFSVEFPEAMKSCQLLNKGFMADISSVEEYLTLFKLEQFQNCERDRLWTTYSGIYDP